MSADKRAALEKLRQIIRSTVPQAEEGVSYGIAAFRLNGKPIAGLGASASHCTYFPMSGATIATLKAELKKYDTSKGAIRFPIDEPLPIALVRKLLKARIAEIEGDTAKPRLARGTTRKQTKATTDPQTDSAVVAFLRALDHPLKKDIEAVRQIILDVGPEIHEGIKWNAPSFRTTEYFATLNLRAKDGKDRVWLILHLGAKAKDNSTKGMKIADPAGIVTWLAKDRCLLTFDDAKDIKAKRTALQAIIREWIREL